MKLILLVIVLIPFMHAQAAPVQKSATKLDAVGVCQVIPNPTVVPDQVGYDLAPWSAAQTYLKKFKNINTMSEDVTAVTVLQLPKHGRLVDNEMYDPEPGYFGKDSVTYLVEIAGYRVKVTHFIQVDTNTSDEAYRKYCPKGEIWKISKDANASNIF